RDAEATVLRISFEKENDVIRVYESMQDYNGLSSDLRTFRDEAKVVRIYPPYFRIGDVIGKFVYANSAIGRTMAAIVKNFDLEKSASLYYAD
ncbi:MAG: hypothetical protein AAF570_26165, partial [Bacteroidota bacterium]